MVRKPHSGRIQGTHRFADLTLSTPRGPPLCIPGQACLQFLSIVETTHIPLYLAVGSPFSVSTSSPDTERWFHDIFLNQVLRHKDYNGARWWEAARQDSPLGVLVAVPGANNVLQSSKPRVTELLFYASRSENVFGTPQTPCSSFQSPNHAGSDGSEPQTTLNVHAIALSSDLLLPAQTTTPPASPIPDDGEIGAYFLPHSFSLGAEVINEPPVRKRKNATDAFDRASERRKKARRKGGEGVSFAAATKADTQTAPVSHRRCSSNTQPAPLQTKPLSRSPSITSSRPPTAVPSAARPSTLSRVQSVTAIPDAPDIETKNKDLVSRIVMAGMRLYGLSQSKIRKSRASSSAPSPAVDATFEELEAERRNDEEFKLIYHQAFKGTCFAFRAIIAERNLQLWSEAIRDTADKLLAIFCSDPLNSLESDMDKVTPAGREAFGSSML